MKQRRCGALGGSLMECGVVGEHYVSPCFQPRHRHPPTGMALPRTACAWLNHLYTGVGCFRSCLYKWGMASSEAYECGAEEQTVEHVPFTVQYRPPCGVHGLTVLDDETIKWLPNIYLEV